MKKRKSGVLIYDITVHHAEEQTSLNFRERQRGRQGGREGRKFEWAQ